MGPKTPHKPGTFNFEINVFRLLQAIKDLLSGATPATPVTVVTTLERVSVSGTVAAGAKAVSIANTGSSDAIVQGAVVKTNEGVSWGTSLSGETLDAIVYDPQSSELLISTSR